MKCDNCGQTVSEKDKFCRYCGAPMPVKEEPPKLKKRDLLDKIQEERATLTGCEIEAGEQLDCALLKVKTIGNYARVTARTKVLIGVYFALAAIIFISALLFKKLIRNDTVGFIILWSAVVIIFFFIAAAMERLYYLKALRELETRSVSTPKMGYGKEPLAVAAGVLFKIGISQACPLCEGELKGELHIENIDERYVAVCNMNRKHFYYVDMVAFIDALTGEEKTG